VVRELDCSLLLSKHQCRQHCCDMSLLLHIEMQTVDQMIGDSVCILVASEGNFSPKQHCFSHKSLRCHWQTALRRGSAYAKYSIPHHIVIKPLLLLGLSVKYSCRRCVWSTVVWRPSEVYDTHRWTKLTAPEMITLISHSKDMVGAHQNLNGSRNLTTPLSGIVCHPWTVG